MTTGKRGRPRSTPKPYVSYRSRTKLTPEIVQEIRRLAADGCYHYAIAEQFGVSQATVTKVVRRQSWKKVLDIDR